MKQKPINTDVNGNAPTCLAGYFKFGTATLIGGEYGTTGCAVLMIYELLENNINI